jgi:protein-L-isoaspartate O-methyltransferase
MPLGEPDSVQRLVKITRRDGENFEREDLGAVRFVPLIGVHGWPDAQGEKR